MSRYKEEQDREIQNLKDQLSKIKKDEEDSIKAMNIKLDKEEQSENVDHEDKYKRHENIVMEEKKKLSEMETKNTTLQNDELSKLTKMYSNHLTTIKDQYDEELRSAKADLQKTKELHEQIHEQMVAIEDEYRRIKHEQEINETIETEWKIKIQKFEMHEKRKEKSAEFVVNMWRAWKENKKKKKKKPKSKPK